jgi:arabinogalactan oligomer/maltooligosaccharide transport system permease protein
MAQLPSSRRRFLAGLALATLAGAGLLFVVSDAARSVGHQAAARRDAVVRLQALAATLDRVGVAGEPARAVVARWAASDSTLRTIRVLAFDGISLEASTATADRGERAAPRRLEREEKPFYDQGQRLRAAVETNVQEEVARKAEIEVEARHDGSLAVAAPLEREGEVVGTVWIETAPQTGPEPGANPIEAALVVLVPVALFFFASRRIGERRGALAAVAAILLLAALATMGLRAAATLRADLQAAETRIAAAVERETQRAGAVAAAVTPDAAVAPLDPARLDVDPYRRPLHGGAPGTPAAAAGLALELRGLARATTGLLGAIGVVALALLGLAGFGVFAGVWDTLRRHREAYAYVLPAMIGMIVLVFYPFLYGVILSFTDATLFNSDKSIPEVWIGLRNYVEVLGDFSIVKHTAEGTVINYLNFYWTFFNTVLWTVLNVGFGVSVGLALALILNTRGLAARPIYRVLLILPWAMPNYITALIWRGMFHQQFGVINQVLQIFGGPPISWFEAWQTSFATVLATNGWLSFPFMMVVSLGALQSIPAELYEASRIDGASRWQQFRSITLPSIKPALVPAIILSVVWTFNMFNIIYLVTQGAPESSTEILITQSYKFAFERYRYGYAAAYSTVIFMILFVYGWWQNRATRATEAIG